MKKRKGIINISRRLIDMLDVQILETILSIFYPIKIIENENENILSYLGYSENFRELHEGDKIPEHEFVLTSINEGEFIEVEIKEIQYDESSILKCIIAIDLIDSIKKDNDNLIESLKIITDERIPQGKIIIGDQLNFQKLKLFEIKQETND